MVIMFDDIIKDWKCSGKSCTPGCAGRPKQDKTGHLGDTRYYDYMIWDMCKGNKEDCPYESGKSGCIK